MCRTLAHAGFRVSLVVANAKSEVKDGVQIIGVPVHFSSRASRILKAPKEVYKSAKEIDAEIYHLHDPELIPYGVKLQAQGKKVIFDSHEDVPADILDKDWLGPKPFRRAISAVYHWYEKRQVRKLSGLISVLDGITSGFKHPKAITIHNYPIVDAFDIEAKQLPPKWEGKFKLVYNGGLTRIRGIHNLVKSMSYLDDDCLLLLMGPWESDQYHHECQALEGWSRVEYLGNVEISECFSILKSCDLGLVMFLPLPNHVESLPNKSFEYVAAGIPMVMSDFSRWRDFFGGYAHFANPEQPEEIANSISMIRNDYTAEIDKVSEEGRRILSSYTWANEGRRLIEFYQEILR
jgi:glycosyltransferase involved in cell wall biosynthesis